MSTQFRVGIFAIITVVALFIVWYVLSNYSLHRNAYTMAVHFDNVSGLQEGASVQLAGVIIGEVDRIELLPDQTVEVFCTINGDNTLYRGSSVMVTTTLTGQSTLSIIPPPVTARGEPLPRGVLPLEQQMHGTLPPSITDLAAQGQAQLKQLDKTLSIVNKELPDITRKFNGVASHTDELITNTNRMLSQLSGQLTGTVAQIDGLIASTQSVLTESGRNVNALTASMRRLVVNNEGRFAVLIDNLAATANNLNKTMQTVSQITADPSVKANLIQTTTNIKDSSEKLKAIASDIQSITGDPSVQGHLRGAIEELDSTIAKANDILGSYSNAQGAVVPPAGHGSVPRGPGAGQTGGSPGTAAASSVRALADNRSHRFGGASFFATQTRETWSTQGGGPSSDLNVVLLPHATSHLTVGANDLGYHPSYNFLIDTKASPRLQYSLGVVYSYLGMKTIYGPFGRFDVDARLFDPRHPKLDLYGDVRLNERLQLFYGERSLLGAVKSPSFGFQVNY